MAEATLFDIKPKMHFARLEKSPRLQRVLKILEDGEPHSTMEIILNAYVCAVNSIVSELRMNGYAINCFRFGTPVKNKFVYQLVGKVGCASSNGD